jgi:hypothetical protein
MTLIFRDRLRSFFFWYWGRFKSFYAPIFEQVAWKNLELLEEVDIGDEFFRTIDFTIAFIVMASIHYIIDSCRIKILTKLRQQNIDKE